MRAREVVLATGAIERPLVFADNDRPGVMLAGAARRYCNQFGVVVGERVVVATSHDSAYRAALDLKSAGVAVELIADLRGEAKGPLPEAARAAGIEVAAGAEILGVDGRLRVKAVHMSSRSQENGGMRRDLMSGGWTPSAHLFSQSRGRLVFDEALQVFRPGASVAALRSAGACNATFDLKGALAEATRPGARRRPPPVSPRRDAGLPVGGALAAWRCARRGERDPRRPPRQGVRRFPERVSAKDVNLAVQEGMRSIEHIKRYTTTGMATDQGKLSNMNALAIAAAALAEAHPEVGLTTFRPPYTPVTFGAFAGPARGDLFDPVRRTPIHDWAAENGAVFEDVGQWKRAWYFPRRGESMHDAVRASAAPPAEASVCSRFDARQDRSRRSRRRCIPRSHVRQHIPEARGRPLPLWHHAARGRVPDGRRGDRSPRDRSLPCHDDDRRRPEVLAHMEDYRQTNGRSWGCMADFGHGTGCRRFGVQGPRAREVLMPLYDLDIPNLTLYCTCSVANRSGWRRASAIVPGQLYRRAGLRNQCSPGCGRSGLGCDFVASQNARPQPLRHRGHACVAVPRRATSSPGRRPMAPRPPTISAWTWAIGKSKRDFVGKRSLSLPALAAS